MLSYLDETGLAYFWGLLKQKIKPNIIGEIKPFIGSTIPPGWLECDGSELLIEDYPELYAILDPTNTGWEEGSTEDYFCLPDLKGYLPVGAGTTQTLYLPRTVGDKKGFKEVKLTSGQCALAPYTFSESRGEFFTSAYVKSYTSGTKRAALKVSSSVPTTVTKNVIGKDATEAHNNLQPYCTVKYIIFTGVFSNE